MYCWMPKRVAPYVLPLSSVYTYSMKKEFCGLDIYPVANDFGYARKKANRGEGRLTAIESAAR